MRTRYCYRALLPLIVLTVAVSAPGILAQTTTNYPPHVVIVAPPDGAMFPGDADLLLQAEAVDPDGSVETVEFFAGNLSLGFGERPAPPAPLNRFELVWKEAPPGIYALTAQATDDGGAVSRLAAPVRVIVGKPEPPARPAVVTIRSADPYAGEACPDVNAPDPGRFVVTRDGPTNLDLVVYVTLKGTAVNGKDYDEVTEQVTIPTGSRSADIWIKPIPDDLEEGAESVVARLEPRACIAIYPPPPECYLVGQPSEAAVYIKDCRPPENRAPAVKIVEPLNGQVFRAPAEIRILTDTWDVDGYVWRVEFFADAKKIGEESKMFLVAPEDGTHIPYEMIWRDAPAGRHVLTARATDDSGKPGWSAPVSIAVFTNDPPPPPTNTLPIVTIAAHDPVAIEGTNCWGWPNLTNRWPVGTTNVCSTDPLWNCRLWWFTNCGPKNATFTVRRTGDAAGDLPVSYSIRGSASNGVDYVELSGTVTIPAGERKASIQVVPKDDPVLEPAETVVLSLLAAAAEPGSDPNYKVGHPGRAAAVIVDSSRPRLRTSALSDKSFVLGVQAEDGAWFRIEHSTDLVNWGLVGTSQVVQGVLHFVDPDAPDLQARFYRAVPEAEPLE